MLAQDNILLRGLKDKTILIVGDLVADQFLHGKISRVSREAPVFILRHENTDTIGGGAANAASNISTLGGKALLVGVIGNDKNGAELQNALKKAGVDISGVVVSDAYQTTTKLRVLAGQKYARRQQVIRIDYENQNELDQEVLNKIEINAIEGLKKADVVVISDYGYGAAEIEFVGRLIELATLAGVPVLVDSRSRIDSYTGAAAATPNQEEVESLLDTPFSEQKVAGLRNKLRLQALVVTLGNKGMYISTEEGTESSVAAIGTAEPVDVTGAGDTVMAAFSLAVAAGFNYFDAARIANHAGGIVVMKNGTATVSFEELLNSIERHEPSLAKLSLHTAK